LSCSKASKTIVPFYSLLKL